MTTRNFTSWNHIYTHVFFRHFTFHNIWSVKMCVYFTRATIKRFTWFETFPPSVACFWKHTIMQCSANLEVECSRVMIMMEGQVVVFQFSHPDLSCWSRDQVSSIQCLSGFRPRLTGLRTGLSLVLVNCWKVFWEIQGNHWLIKKTIFYVSTYMRI